MSRAIVTDPCADLVLPPCPPWGLNAVGAGFRAPWCQLESPMTSDADSDDNRRRSLMAAAQAGDRAAYTSLLREAAPLIRAVAAARGVPADGLDDTVQETLITIHDARHTYDPSRSFTAWLRVIAERRAVDFLRRRGRKQRREVHAPIAYEQYPDPAMLPPDELGDAQAWRRIADAASTLPMRQREAIDALVFQGHSLAEASAMTRRTKTALKVSLHRALQALRSRLRPEA